MYPHQCYYSVTYFTSTHRVLPHLDPSNRIFITVLHADVLLLKGVWTRLCVCVCVCVCVREREKWGCVWAYLCVCECLDREGDRERALQVGAGTGPGELSLVQGASMASSHGRSDLRFADWMASLPQGMHTIPLTNLAIPGRCFFPLPPV